MRLLTTRLGGVDGADTIYFNTRNAVWKQKQRTQRRWTGSCLAAVVSYLGTGLVGVWHQSAHPSRINANRLYHLFSERNRVGPRKTAAAAVAVCYIGRPKPLLLLPSVPAGQRYLRVRTSIRFTGTASVSRCCSHIISSLQCSPWSQDRLQ